MPAPKKSAPKKTAPKKVVAKKAAPKKAAPKKAVAVKATVKKTATKSAVKKTVAKKAAVKKPTATKTVLKAKAKPVAKKAAPKKVAPKKAAPRGVPEILRDAALKVLDERQAEGIVTVDLQGRSAMADYAIIASGRSSRQLAAIADYLREAFMKAGVRQVRIEGVEQGDWVLIDGGDVLVHLFRPDVRQYYQIEEIWSSNRPARR